MTTEREARMGLASVWQGCEPRVARLVEERGAVEVWDYLRKADGAAALRAAAVNLAKIQAETEKCRAHFLIPDDPQWPASLAGLRWSEPVGHVGGEPFGLWVLGQVDLCHLSAKAVAVVGSRASTAYGEHVCAELASGMAEQGYTIVSGGAYGIDAAAHRAALSVAGATIAVMAGGLAQFYPPGNAALVERVGATGAVISECPPHQHPTRAAFLVRNRLIAALGQATVVVEAAVRSGAQNTVSWAQSLGRPVVAIPGPITSAMSQTPHRLIRNGEAQLATTVDEVLSAIEPLDPSQDDRPWQSPLDIDSLSDEDKQVLECLRRVRGVSLDEIVQTTGSGPAAVMSSLAKLVAEGFACDVGGGYWKRVSAR